MLPGLSAVCDAMHQCMSTLFCQVLKNLQTHLLEEEKRLHVQGHHSKKILFVWCLCVVPFVAYHDHITTWFLTSVHRKVEKEKENQNLKELGDTQSGYVYFISHFLFFCFICSMFVQFLIFCSHVYPDSTTSAVMQVYLKSVLESFLHLQPSVRMASLHVVNLILRQGLVHPVQVSTLLIISTTGNFIVVTYFRWIYFKRLILSLGLALAVHLQCSCLW